MSRADVEAVLRLFFSYSRCVYRTEEPELKRVSRAMLEVCKARFNHILRSASSAGSPIMIVHESDGYSCDMMQTVTAPMLTDASLTLHRVGRHRQEWLLELVLLKAYDLQGKLAQAIRYFAPRAVEGKTGWYMFNSSLDTVSLLQMGGLRQCD